MSEDERQAVRRAALEEALKVAMLEWSGSKRTGQERETAWRIADGVRGLIDKLGEPEPSDDRNVREHRAERAEAKR